MDWNDLQYALALSRAGTLSGAAELLGVVRTTVGRRIRAMESDMGARLFDATPEGFVPTIAGLEVVELAERMEAEVLVTQGRLLGRDAELRGRLRVSTLGFVYASFLPIFASFMERYPGIELTIVVTERQVSLLRREADVVLRVSKAPGPSLVGRQLVHLDFAPYASQALVARVGEGAPLSEFPWIHDDERGETQWLDVWLAEHAPGARVAFRTNHHETMRVSVREGLGVHFLPCIEADKDPNLVRVGPTMDGESRPLWALTLADLRSNRRVRAFLDHVQEGFAALRT